MTSIPQPSTDHDTTTMGRRMRYDTDGLLAEPGIDRQAFVEKVDFGDFEITSPCLRGEVRWRSNGVKLRARDSWEAISAESCRHVLWTVLAVHNCPSYALCQSGSGNRHDFGGRQQEGLRMGLPVFATSRNDLTFIIDGGCRNQVPIALANPVIEVDHDAVPV